MNETRLTVLVTGATGFVGSHIAEAVVAAGYRLRYTVRATSDLRWLRGLEAERVEVDFARPGGMDEAVIGADVVVHAAGITRAANPAEYGRVNAEATERLARAAASAGARRFVLISSLAARGPTRPNPEPTSHYGRSKREAERRLRAFAAEAGVDFEPVILRPAGVYGPRDSDMLPLFQMAQRGILVAPAGAARLQPVFANDVADATVRAVGGADTSGGEPLPIAEPFVYDWSEVAHSLGDVFGRKVRLVRVAPWLFEAAGSAADSFARLSGVAPTFDRRRARDLSRLEWTVDVTVTEQALGWSPRVPLAEGLAITASWYREAGWLSS